MPSPFFVPCDSASAATFRDSSLLLSVISLANVPSLCVDVLIENLGLRRVGTLSSRYHAPLLGALDTQRTLAGFSTAIDADTPKDQKDAFIAELSAWISSAGFARVLVLGATDATRRDMGSAPSPFRCLGTGDLASRLAQSTPPLADAALVSAGITRRLMVALAELPAVDVAALVQYVVEAENDQDAFAMADAVVELLPEAGALRSGSAAGKWAAPRSWAVGLFGRGPSHEMY